MQFEVRHAFSELCCHRPAKGAYRMSLKALFFSIGCVAAWILLLPMLVLAGGLTLLAYAIVAELTALVTGNPPNSLDSSAARATARRMCWGYDAGTNRH